MKIPWHKRIYALYKGEQFVAEGTIREISRYTNKSVDFLRYMTYPIYEKRCGIGPKRLRLIPLDDEQVLIKRGENLISFYLNGEN